jgi:hypothetical protein
MDDVRKACCDINGENCNTQSSVPLQCPVGCALVFPRFVEKCRAHIKAHQTPSWEHSANAINLKVFEGFEQKCLKQDSMAMVEYALEMKDKGCKIDLQHAVSGRRLQQGQFMSQWLNTPAASTCSWDKLNEYSQEVDRICCGPTGANCHGR